MAIRVNTNIASLSAQRNLATQNTFFNRTLERLSTGLKINRAADNTAGLAIAVKLLTQSDGYSQAISNAQDSLNLASTAESGIDQTTDILQRLRELAVKSASDTTTQDDRALIDIEVAQLRDELDRVADTTNYNTRQLLDGSIATPKAAVDANVELEDNARVGEGASISDLVTSVSSFLTTIDADAAFQLTIKSSTTTTSGIELEISSSAEGVLGTYDVGSGSTVTQVALTLDGVAVATLDISAANITLSDIGETALVQAIQAENAVTDNNALTFQVGANEGELLTFGVSDLRARALNVEGLSFLGSDDADSRLKAQNAIGVIDAALEKISTERTKIGAFQNRLEYRINNLSVQRESSLAAASLIRDANLDEEISNLTRAQILSQSAAAALTEANLAPQTILELL